jgi:hypothetical protein
LTASSIAALKARGNYDPGKHPDASKYPPLTTEEHLEILAAGEMLARYYRHPVFTHDAVMAGALWAQVAAATGADEAQVRQRYREWADGQHRLHAYYGGMLGMDDAEHAATITRAAEPPAWPRDRPEDRTAASVGSRGQRDTETARGSGPCPAQSRAGLPEQVRAETVTISADEKQLILAALDEAGDNKRDRAANCTDCADQSCGTCQYRLQIADAYDHLAAQLLDAKETSVSDQPHESSAR